MAKKKSATTMSKSGAIRDYASNNASAKPKAIAEALNKQGYKVTPQYVSMILSNDRRKGGKTSGTRGRRKKVAAVAAPPAAKGKEVSMADLLAAKQLIQSTGSLAKAKAALDAYTNLVG